MSNTVHIVDDDASFREATARLLRTAGFDVVEYASADQILERLPRDAEPACLLLDVRMPRVTGPQLQDQLMELGFTVPVVFLTGYGDIPMTVRAMKRGAEDFLTKPVDAEQLFDAIERAMARHRTTMAQHSRMEALQVRTDKLTPREREVFEHVAKGRQNKQIAFELGTTVRTIKAHRHRVMEKLDAMSLIELVSIARALGVLPPDPRADVDPN
jgi:FixJ family two-component response regulator